MNDILGLNISLCDPVCLCCHVTTHMRLFNFKSVLSEKVKQCSILPIIKGFWTLVVLFMLSLQGLAAVGRADRITTSDWRKAESDTSSGFIAYYRNPVSLVPGSVSDPGHIGHLEMELCTHINFLIQNPVKGMGLLMMCLLPVFSCCSCISMGTMAVMAIVSQNDICSYLRF